MMASSAPIQYHKQPLFPGSAGTLQTLLVMAGLARLDSQRPQVQHLALQLQNPANLEHWLRSVWQFVADPAAYEFVKSPALQIDQAANQGGRFTGDCDDAATLAASILAALDWPCRLVAVRLRTEKDFSHVFVRAPLFEYSGAGFQLDIDPIVPAEFLPLAGDFETMTVDV
jgi:transglutaminase-like putative cysteine protease